MVGDENIQTVDKRTAAKSDVIETHNVQQIRVEPEKMGLGNIVDEIISIPHGVYQQQGSMKRRDALVSELNKRGELLAKKGKK